MPVFFPTEEKVPESAWHRKASALLTDSVEREFTGRALLSSDQFLYWDPTNPKRCLAPDLAVRLGAPSELLQSWKTWERGAPHLGVELVSQSDHSELRFEEKLERYRHAGVGEVVRFDHDDPRHPIRIWDLVDGDLVERDLSSPDALLCDALELYWCVHTDSELGPVLRLARDVSGHSLILTRAEAERAEKELERAEKELALQRIHELEAELARGR
jgi:Uma2 family endonuclease